MSDDARAGQLRPVPAPAAKDHPAGPAPAWMEGDVADQLEELVAGPTEVAPSAGVEGHAVEVVGPHLRVAGQVQLGYHRRLSEYINNHLGLILLHDATVLRRNGDPTRVYAPSLWVNLDDVTLVGQVVDDKPADAGMRVERRQHTIIAVTQGHTLTGDMHLAPEAALSGYVESPEPRFVALTEVRTRSLADRRVIARYAFALLNRRQIVAITELQPGMIRGRGAI